MKLFKIPRFFRIIFPNKTWDFHLSKNSVFLTFDDGPDKELTTWVLDYLNSKGIKTTFFCVGENVKNNPDVFYRIVEEGHSVGNHTMYHDNGVKTNDKEYLDSINEAAKLIPGNLFRPPYGRIKLKQTKEVCKNYKIIMWSWLSYDFDRSVSVDLILKKAQKQIKGGDIIVLHDNPKTADRLKILLPKLIEIIEAKNLQFSKIPQS